MAEGEPVPPSSRNFRSSYYEKLGFSGNEERNLLDSLLVLNPLDFDKLNDLRERLDLDKRCVEAWKILLGVECGRKSPFDEFANVRRIRAEHFLSLKHHLEVLLKHNLVMRDRLKKYTIANNKSHINGNERNENDENQSDQLDICSNLLSSNQDINSSNREENHQKNHKLKSQNLESNENKSLSSMIDEGIEHHGSITSIGNVDLAVSRNLENMGKQNSDGNHEASSQTDLLADIESNPGIQITLMYLLEAGLLDSSDIGGQLSSLHCRKLSAMALFFVNIANDLQEAFFLFRNLTRKIEEAETNSGNASLSSSPNLPKSTLCNKA